ncbi:hypothetical protein NPIL_450861 [Nephila pilipes]|uniref:Uncharacterized protein n=1 Tax=Nephila pilipes TaxID=299642 RepID=A0A8X6NFU1_NEPPI|nr:hypothetical protein NPIL_450861 [Nephila pilipes]
MVAIHDHYKTVIFSMVAIHGHDRMATTPRKEWDPQEYSLSKIDFGKIQSRDTYRRNARRNRYDMDQINFNLKETGLG